MTVDEWEVPYEMYRYAVMMNLRDRANEINADAGKTVTAEGTAYPSAGDIITEAVGGLSDEDRRALAEEVDKNAIETIVNIYSLFTAAKKEGIDPFDKNVDSLTEMKMKEIRATYENDKEYLEAIKQFFMNNSVYSVLTRYEIVFDQLYELYVKNGVIDTSDSAVIAAMKGDDAVRVKQILISFERHSDDEALSVANTVYAEVMTYVSEDGIMNEEKFDELTKKYGEDLFMFNNRDGYYIYKGYSDKDFETAAFALDMWHVSEPVRTSKGYSIMMKAPKEDSYIESEKHFATLKENYLGGLYRGMLDEYSDGAKVVTNEEYSKIDIFSMK